MLKGSRAYRCFDASSRQPIRSTYEHSVMARTLLNAANVSIVSASSVWPRDEMLPPLYIDFVEVVIVAAHCYNVLIYLWTSAIQYVQKVTYVPV